jgi:hypothetical protein
MRHILFTTIIILLFCHSDIYSQPSATFNYATDNYKQNGTDVTITINLNSIKAGGEYIFVRYTTNGWVSSFFVPSTGSGTLYTAVIPGSGVTGTASNQYYILSCSVSNPSDANADAVTINFDKNSGRYYQLFSKYITMRVNHFQGEQYGPWMVSTYGLFPTCTAVDVCSTSPTGMFAYNKMEFNSYGGLNNNNCGCTGTTGSGVLTVNYGVGLQTNVLKDVNALSIFLSPATLTGFTSGCPNGDTRIYSGTSGNIQVNSVIKLSFNDFRFIINVSYTIAPTTGSGWAQIDKANCDPRWAAEFDPYNTGQVEFQFQVFAQNTAECYGDYNIVFEIVPASVSSKQATGIIPVEGKALNITVPLDNANVSMNFTSSSFGGVSNGVMATEIIKSPGGSMPSGINMISPFYWTVATSLDTFKTNITFSLADLGGVTSSSNLRLLKRDFSSSSWTTWSDYFLIDPTHIRANNITFNCDWSIGTIGSDPLPVELSSFYAETRNGFIMLDWKTATEVYCFGFEVERRGNAICDQWTKIGFVHAKGNSNSMSSYSFKDALDKPGKYYYRLKLIDNNGQYDYSNIMTIEFISPLRYELAQNYPNPFNPTTTIRFDVPNSSQITLKVYDILGKEIATLVDEKKEPGSYQVQFGRGNISSGIYIYQMHSNNYVQTRKMVIVK